MSRASARKISAGADLMARSWNHLKAHSLKCLVVKAVSSLGLQQRLSAETPTRSLSMRLIGLPHIMAAGFQDWACPKNQALKVTFHYFCYHHSPPRFKGRVHRLCLLMGKMSVKLQDRLVRWETQPCGENSTCHPLRLPRNQGEDVPFQSSCILCWVTRHSYLEATAIMRSELS